MGLTKQHSFFKVAMMRFLGLVVIIAFLNYVAPAAYPRAEEWEILNDMRLLEVEMDEIELELMEEVPEDLQWRMLVRVEKLYAKIRKMLANINIDFENKGRFRIPVEFRSKCVKARMDQANEIIGNLKNHNLIEEIFDFE